MKLNVQIKVGRQHLYLIDNQGSIVATTDSNLLYNEVNVSDSNDTYCTFKRNGIIHLENAALVKWQNLGCPMQVEIDDSGFLYSTFCILADKHLVVKQFKNRDEAVEYAKEKFSKIENVTVTPIELVEHFVL